MVYMVLTVWQVTHFWKVWYLQSAQSNKDYKKEETQEKISERKAV